MRRLTTKANADMMSDMKTFTVRELDREPSRVLDTCDAEGAVRIRRRDGRAYALIPEQPAPQKTDGSAWIKERRKRLNETFPVALTKKQARELDRLIAGK